MSLDKDGTVQLARGRLVVVDPVGRGYAARVAPTEQVCLVRNGVRCTTPVAVHEGDELRIEIDAWYWADNLEVRVSPDLMRASLIVGRGLVYRPALADGGPSNVLLLEVKEDRILDIEEGVRRVEAALRDNGVVFGVMPDAIRAALDDPRGTEVVVACGEEPVPPSNGEVRVLVEQSARLTAPPTLPDGSVDYRSIRRDPCVEPGDVIAELVDGMPGRPGCTVTGRAVEPSPRAKPRLLAGPGARLDGDGRKAIAAIAGRPAVEGGGSGETVVRVLPVLVHEGDVNLATGNLDFRGDIVVTGDVTDTMKLAAGGNVRVLGSVSRAEVCAGGRIEVLGGVINSTLKAGEATGTYGRLESLCESIRMWSSGMSAISAQLKTHPGPEVRNLVRTGWLRLVPELSRAKFPQVFQTLDEAHKLMEAGESPRLAKVRHVVEAAEELLSGSPGHDRLDEIAESADRVLEILRKSVSSDDNGVYIGYAQNCRIEAAGPVTVGHRGCYMTEVVTLGNVQIQGPFCGGSVSSLRGSVSAVAVGSPAEPRTTVEVAAGCRVSCGTVFGGVVIRIGRACREITRMYRSVQAYLDPRGDLALSGSQDLVS